MVQINFPDLLNPDTLSVLGWTGCGRFAWKPILGMSKRR